MNDKKAITISFELFPPKTAQGLISLTQTWRTLNNFSPEYFSVTFGAGGGTQNKTLPVIQGLCQDNITAAPHLTCIGLTREHIEKILQDYQAMGITRLVVLRGDLPAEGNTNSGDFSYAEELVRFIRQKTGDYFFIEVAAYPEFHPQANNANQDLEFFKQKVLAGANQAITQYFYNKEAYLLFMEACQKIGITIPIIPGIMPIHSLSQLLRFSKTCGADVPMWLSKRLQAYQHDEASMRALGIEMVTRLCADLIEAGAPSLHFYTLNKVEPTASIINNLLGSSKHGVIARHTAV